MVPKEDEVSTMSLLDQPCAAVLSATVWMWDSGATCGANRWKCASKADNSKVLNVM